MAREFISCAFARMVKARRSAETAFLVHVFSHRATMSCKELDMEPVNVFTSGGMEGSKRATDVIGQVITLKVICSEARQAQFTLWPRPCKS